MQEYQDLFGTKEWARTNVNFASGCSYNCRYCYAKRFALRFGRIKDASEWAQMKILRDKVNKEYRKREGTIMLPTSHDITPHVLLSAIKVIRKLLEAGNDLLITTKPHPICIFSICNEFEKFRDQITFRFTVTSNDERILRFWEPGAPLYRDRVQSIKDAYEEGFNCTVSCEPFLSDPEEILRDVEEYVSEFWIGLMTGIPRQVPNNERDEYDRVRMLYKKENLIALYHRLKDNEKVRWKESIRKRLIKWNVWEG